MSDERDLFQEFIESDEFSVHPSSTLSMEEIPAVFARFNESVQDAQTAMSNFAYSYPEHPQCRCVLIPVQVQVKQPSIFKRVWLRIQRILSRLSP